MPAVSPPVHGRRRRVGHRHEQRAGAGSADSPALRFSTDQPAAYVACSSSRWTARSTKIGRKFRTRA
jgi:hypothetical protein